MDKEAAREAAKDEVALEALSFAQNNFSNYQSEFPDGCDLGGVIRALARGYFAGYAAATAEAEAKVKGLVERLEWISYLLSSDHVQHNKHRMGLLACRDIDDALDAARGEGKDA